MQTQIRQSLGALRALKISFLLGLLISASATAAPMVFPQIGVQLISGTQAVPTANINAIAQYQWILMGGNYPSWPAANVLHGGYATRDQVVVALKSQTHTGKNAVTPQVIQYENFFDDNPSAPWFPEWDTAVHSNNWILYQSGSSGPIAASSWSSGWIVVNPAHLVGTDKATGLYPMALAAKLLYQRYYLGTGSGGIAMAAPHLDGYYVDDDSARDMWGNGAADWLRNGSNPSNVDVTTTAAVSQGKADYPAELASLNSSIIPACNNEFGYDMSPANSGGLGLTTSNLTGKCLHSMQQFMYATAGGQNNVLSFGGFAGFMAWYQTIDANVKSGGQAVLTGGVSLTDYQLVRYSLCATLMRNGIAVYGITNSASASNVSDTTDASNPATFPQFDEFWGGSLNLAGYLGAAASTTQGAVQTAAWQNGVWRRDFVNGIALVNPAGNGPQTVTLETAYQKLTGTQAPSVNNGQKVTSVTLAAGDGLILMRTTQVPTPAAPTSVTLSQ
jgi:hypothetical protein